MIGVRTQKDSNLTRFGGREGAISAQSSFTSLSVADELIGCNKNLCDQRFGRLIAVDPYCVKGKHYKTKWICICDCGNETIVSAHDLVDGRTKSCGCLVVDIQRERLSGLTGNKNPCWDPKLQHKHRIDRRYMIEYKQWRTAVFERDQYTCCKCGTASGSYMNAHHLDCYADNPDKRYDVSNGRTLCRSCHLAFHKEYGRMRNTRLQYEEWINKLGFPLPVPLSKLASSECSTEIGGDVILDPLTCACWQGENTLAFHTASRFSQGTPYDNNRGEFALSPGRIRVSTAGGVVADEKTRQQKPMQPTHVVGPLYSRS